MRVTFVEVTLLLLSHGRVLSGHYRRRGARAASSVVATATGAFAATATVSVFEATATGVVLVAVAAATATGGRRARRGRGARGLAFEATVFASLLVGATASGAARVFVETCAVVAEKASASDRAAATATAAEVETYHAPRESPGFYQEAAAAAAFVISGTSRDKNHPRDASTASRPCLH